MAEFLESTWVMTQVIGWLAVIGWLFVKFLKAIVRMDLPTSQLPIRDARVDPIKPIKPSKNPLDDWRRN